MRRLLPICITASLWAAEPEWPQFRGPDSNPVGTHKSLPDTWSLKENIEWSAEIPGRGWSSPVVADGKIYLTTVTTDGKSKPPQTGTDYSNEYVAELRKQGLSEAETMAKVTARDIELPHEVTLHYFLLCMDLKTGAVIWNKEIHSGRPPGGRHRKNSFASETPATDGKMVYVFIGNLGLFAYDLKGQQVWKAPLEANPIYLDFGTGGSPVVYGNQVFVLNDNEKQPYLAAFDKKTGKQLWRVNREVGEGQPPRRSGWTTPYVWKHKQRTELVTTGPGLAISYSLDGKELWRLKGMSGIPVPSPFAYGGLLFVNGGLGKSMFAVRPGASGDITPADQQKSNEYVAWVEPRGGTYLPTQVAYEGALYALTEKGVLTRYNAQTGAVTYKSRLDPAAGTFTSSLWAYKGKVFCLNEEGKTYVVDAGETFKVSGANSLDEMAQATPAIIGDRLLLRTETKLYSIRQGARQSNRAD